MTASERSIRILLAFQGILYLAFGVWALIATASYLEFIHPKGSMLETRELAAVTCVAAVFFIAGAWRKDLMRPAAFLGLGTALALTIVQLFHLPAVGLTWLIGDFVLELVMSALYVAFVFFRRDPEPAPAKSDSASGTESTAITPMKDDSSAVADGSSSDGAASADSSSSDGGGSDGGAGGGD